MLNHELLCFGCMHRLPAPGAVCPHCGHDNRIRVNDPVFLPATVLQGQYFIGRALGRGGFGVTYLGYDMNLDRLVAVKEYFPVSIANRREGSYEVNTYNANQGDFEHGCQRALEEGRMVARMGSVRGVVQIYNVFQANGTVYIVMEYVQGMTLATLVKRSGGRLAWKQLLDLMSPIMDALHTIHGMRVVHRDVSPDNIIIRPNGQAVLLDFGAAHNVSEHTYSEHSVSLRMGYAPIEQYSRTGKQDGRIDEYALCATMYYALTGTKPPDATERLFEEAPMQPLTSVGVPAAVEQVLRRGMSVKAQDRYESMAEFKAALLAADGMAVAVNNDATLPDNEVVERLNRTMPVDTDATMPAEAVAQVMAQRGREVTVHDVMRDATIPADAIPKYAPQQPAQQPVPKPAVPAPKPPAPAAPKAEKKPSLEELAGQTSSQASVPEAKPKKKGRAGLVFVLIVLLCVGAWLGFGGNRGPDIPSIDPFNGIWHTDYQPVERRYIQFIGVDTKGVTTLSIPASFGTKPENTYTAGIIGDEAFRDLVLSKVTLPDTLFYISPSAFTTPSKINFNVVGNGADTCFALGLMFHEAGNAERSVYWYQKAIEKTSTIPAEREINVYKGDTDERKHTIRHKPAIAAAGDEYRWAIYDEEIDPKALLAFQRVAASYGSTKSMVAIGNAYYFLYDRYGIAQDMKEAVKWYSQASDDGDIEGTYYLVNFYENGWGGLPHDEAKARQMLMWCAEAGLEEAMHDVAYGYMYADWKGEGQDYAKGREWLLKIVEKKSFDLPFANYELGRIYYEGLGVKKDHKTAVSYFSAAAEEGYEAAYYYLGLCYEKGHGVKQNKNTAREWYNKANESRDMLSDEMAKNLDAALKRVK